MQYPATDYVRALQTKGSNYGLSRTRALLNALGSPDKKLKIIHVAGTNGKGSVCAYVTAALIAAGKTVGTFTSPAVYDYCEQFCVNGKCSADLCEKYLSLTLSCAKKMQDAPTAFETETCAALLMFYSEGCEYAVIECGLGGLTDATNTIAQKELAIISSISLEHTALLGDTTIKIAEQKAGIIKGCKAVINPLQPPEVLRYFADIGGVIAPTPTILSTRGGCEFMLEGKAYKTNLNGYVQAYNAAAAITACASLGLDDNAIYSGISAASLPGRAQVIKADKTYILDGAHNPAAFRPLKEYLTRFTGGVTIIYGALKDKDYIGCLKELYINGACLIAVTPNSPRARNGLDIYTQAQKIFTYCDIKNNVTDALECARGQTVVVCGSFTLLKEAKQWIEKRQ